jgi:chromosome partitioning protein
MRRIAILNQKGGVGKTTTAVNLSAALARRGWRVCLADLDPQAHASLHLSKTLEPARLPDRSIYDVFVNEARIPDILQRAGEGLWVLGAHIDLAAVELELSGVARREIILRERLRAAETPWDFLVIDCPPSLGILTLNALSAAEEVIIPLQPHFLALHGLSKLLETIQLVSHRVNPRLRLTGVLLCMFETGTKLATEVQRDVTEFLQASRGVAVPWAEARVFSTRIRRNIKLAEAPSFGQSIFEYDARSPGAIDYDAFAEEFLSCGGRQGDVSPDEFARRMAELSQPIVSDAVADGTPLRRSA